VAQFTSNSSNYMNNAILYNASSAMISSVVGLGNIYVSTFSGSTLSFSTGSVYASSIYAYTTSSPLMQVSSMLVGAPLATNSYWMMDINGYARGAMFYSSFTTGGTTTITPSTYFGVYYNIINTGNYTIALAGSQPASNIGKYYTFRNNTASDLSITITGGVGITTPLTLYASNTAIIMVATTSTYALF